MTLIIVYLLYGELFNFLCYFLTLALAIVHYLSLTVSLDKREGCCISSEESSSTVCEAPDGAGRVMHIKASLKLGQPGLAFPVCSLVGG